VTVDPGAKKTRFNRDPGIDYFGYSEQARRRLLVCEQRVQECRVFVGAVWYSVRRVHIDGKRLERVELSGGIRRDVVG
jgi:hypothetical protein